MVVGVVVVGAFVVVLSSSSNVSINDSSSRKSVDLFIKDQSLDCVSTNFNMGTSNLEGVVRSNRFENTIIHL